MKPTSKTIFRAIRNMVAGSVLACLAVAHGQSVKSGLPLTLSVARQNEIIQTYCAVCHDATHRNGGISFERFNAANPDPGDAAMMVAKIKTGAMGAAGVPVPDDQTVEALVDSLSRKAASADKWTIHRSGGQLTASIVRDVPSTVKGAPVPDLYRLTLTCNPAAHTSEFQLAWSPGVPKSGQVILVAADESEPSRYTVTGTESMSNGTKGESGPGATLLDRTPLPVRSLKISNAFPDETVAFPFADLAPEVRQSLSACFAPEHR